VRNFSSPSGETIWFHNSKLVSTGQEVGYFPGVDEMLVLHPKTSLTFVGKGPQGIEREVKKCQNAIEHQVCNWLILAESDRVFCLACDLNRVIPDLSVPQNYERWSQIEAAKRRALYQILKLQLPVISKAKDEARGLAFAFMADIQPGGLIESFYGEQRVVTGHSNGLITINIEEADDIVREKNRLRMLEPYRTLLGHFRHEIAHYYWDLFILNTDEMKTFEKIFGDWRLDYSSALQAYYQQGPRSGWPDEFISAYSTAHPWEDWAETWAHYMHITGTLETAHSHDMLRRAELFPIEEAYWNRTDAPLFGLLDFDIILESWLNLSTLLNDLNVSMGHSFAYPFTIGQKAKTKLAYVHEVIGKCSGSNLKK